jgi:hypothetical protein
MTAEALERNYFKAAMIFTAVFLFLALLCNG